MFRSFTQQWQTVDQPVVDEVVEAGLAEEAAEGVGGGEGGAGAEVKSKKRR